MLRNAAICANLAFVLFCYGCEGSLITSTSKPNVVHPSLTSSMEIYCSVDESPASIVIGRDLHERSRSSITHDDTEDDIQFVTSLVIRDKDGKVIASLTEHTPARVLVNSSNVAVTGSLSPTSNPRGHLTLTLTYPTADQATSYVCEADGVVADGHAAQLSESLEVTAASPSIDDLVSHIQSLEKNAVKQETRLKDQDNKIQKLQQETISKDAEIMALVNKTRHIETGSLECGGLYKSNKSVSHSFKTPYDQPPIVYVSTLSFDLEGVERQFSGDHQIDFWLDSVTTTGFSATCKAYSDADRVNRNTIKWISFAS